MSVWAKLEFERSEAGSPRGVIFRLEGALTDSKESYEFLDAVKADAKRGRPVALINLEMVERITSSGIGILCACFTSVLSAAGELHLVGVSKRNQTLLQAVGLWGKLAVHDSEEGVNLD